MGDFEEAKAFLMKDEKGSSMFEHISNVLLKVLTERPNDAVAIFEQISASVKNEAFDASEGDNRKQSLHDNQRVAMYCKSIAKLAKTEEDVEEEPAQDEEENKEEEEEAALADPRPQVIEDFEAQSANWKAAGVTITSGDLFKLQLSLARLAGENDSIETLRLWGKLLGRNADYFVAEGTGVSAEQDEDESAEEPEPEANKFTYWVCKYPGGPWTQLGPVRPKAIVVARQIKRFMTGDLDANVLGYPSFPGKERDYIRAQIALINADCALAPKGAFVLGEDGDTVDVDDEFKVPEAGELADVSSWETFGLPFSTLGRVKPLVSEDEEGNEISQPEGWEAQLLRETEVDQWVVRRYPRTLAEAKSSKVILRSTRWPGAFSVACPNSNTWTNIYVGYGFEKKEELYTPPMPPSLQKEFDVSGLVEQQDIVEDPTPPEEEGGEAEE